MLKKSFGQHFLKDDSICEKIVEAAKIEHDDFVVEIGPGAGALTRFIIKRIAFRSDCSLKISNFTFILITHVDYDRIFGFH